MNHTDDNRRRPPQSLAVFGTSLAVGSAVLILGGYWMDQRAGGGYRYTLTGLVLAILYVIYETWKLTRALAAQEPEAGQDDRPSSSPPADKTEP